MYLCEVETLKTDLISIRRHSIANHGPHAGHVHLKTEGVTLWSTPPDFRSPSAPRSTSLLSLSVSQTFLDPTGK